MSKHPIDVAVGGRVRELRIRAGLSQVELGREIGVSFQQVQKYENGANRMGASRLCQVAATIGVPVATLFAAVPSAGNGAEPIETPLAKDAAKVARDWAAIPDAGAREALAGVVRAMARDSRMRPPGPDTHAAAAE